MSIKKMDLDIRRLEKSYKSILPGAKPPLRAPGMADRDATAAGMGVLLSWPGGSPGNAERIGICCVHDPAPASHRLKAFGLQVP